MARYVVTGGAGFIGSHLVNTLDQAGHEVIVLDNLSSGKRANLPRSVTLIEGDITDQNTLTATFKGADGCFHLAAETAVQRPAIDWLSTHHVNLTGTIKVFNAALTANHDRPIPVIYASSAAVYGDTSVDFIHESTMIQPHSAYGADKRGCELHAYIASQSYHIPTIGLRLFNVYGPNQGLRSRYSGVVTTFLKNIINQESLNIYGDGEQTRDFIFVDDIVACFIKAMQYEKKVGQVYNVCTGKKTSINQLAKLLLEIHQQDIPINYSDARQCDILESGGNPEKAQQELQFKAMTTIESGLRTLNPCDIL